MAPRKKAALRPQAAVDKEMSDLGAVRKVRFGLASKFTAPVSAMLSFAIILMGFVVYNTTSESLQLQLNQQGVFAARIAAAPEIDSWDEDYNTYENLSLRIGRIAAELALIGSMDPEKVAKSPTATDEEKRMVEKIRNHDSTQERYNLERLRHMIGSDRRGTGIYLDLWILNKEGRSKVTAGHPTGFQHHQQFQLPSSPETEIHTGTYVGDSGTEPARFFGHPIKDKDGQVVGKAVVIFSEAGIRADLNSLRAQIMIFCVLGILASAAVAFFTAKTITRPLSSLMKDIKTVAEGDLAHRTRVRSNDELGTLALAFDQMTRNLAAAELMRVDLADKEHQVSLAHEVQERLFPKQLPQNPSLSLEAHNRLVSDLSADLFDALTLEDGRVALLVMTASGRGIPAAIVLSMARTLFRARGIEHPSPARGLQAINTLLSPDLRRGMYVSALYAIVDPSTGQGVLASAGHRVPALHFIASSGGLRRVQADGIAIGLDKGPVFERSMTETAFTLEPGDRLVLATEGAFLLQDAEGNPLGEDAFLRVVLAACRKGADVATILSTLETRHGARPGDHDITLVMAARS
jgi:serine phosphatase RsbU (regulator of sigma subunit)